MLTATVSHHFSAGHRIVGLSGPGAKCANVHGHTFGVEWTVQLPDLTAGSVEFGTLKQLFRGWVDGHLDHGFLVHRDDVEMGAALIALRSKHMVMDTRPTTEAIASLIAEKCQAIAPDILIVEVRVTEGPHNAATWTYDWQNVTEVDASGAVVGISRFDPYKAHMEGNAKFDQENPQWNSPR